MNPTSPSILDTLNAQNEASRQQAMPSAQPSTNEPIISQDQYNAQKAPAPTPTTPATADPSAGDGGNFFTKLLPTLGSIAAPVIGGLLAPETGGLSLLAGLALAGGGSGAGKAVENGLEGKANIGDGVLQEAGMGAGGQLVGAGVGKLIGGVAKGIGGVAEKGIAGKAGEATAVNNVENQQALQNVWGGLKTKTRQANNFNDTVNLADNLGVDRLSPKAFSDTSTNAGDIYNNFLNETLSKAGGVDTNGLNGMIKDAIGEKASTLGGTDAVALSKGRMGLPNNEATKLQAQVQQELGGLFNQGTADPVALREATSRIGNLVGDAKPGISATTGAVDPVQQAKYNVLSNIYNKLKDLTYNRPGVIQATKDAQGTLQASDVGGNQALADHINQSITNAQHPQDILDSYKQFVNMGKLGKEGQALAQDTARPATLNAAKQDVPELSTSAGAIPTSKTGIAASLLNNTVGAVGAGGKVSQVASKLANTLTSASKVAPNIYKTNAGLLGTIGAQGVAGSTNFAGPAGTGNAVNTINIPQGSGNTLSDIMNSNNPAAASAKMALISSMFRQPGEASSNPMADPGIQAYLNSQQQLKNSGSQVNDYINTLNQAGGAQGGPGGLLAQLGGIFTGGPARAAEMQKAQLEASLSQALGHQVSLPGLTMNQGGANSVLAQLQSGLGAASGAQ
jgi:hypothetical protein